jgi:paraquat-inducible protein B
MTIEEKIPVAQVTPLKSISVIWLIPITAVLIGIWMIYFHLSSLGPLVVINFKTAEGIEAGKTKVKIRNVEVGLVESVELNNSLEGVAVTARIHKHDQYLLKKDTQFWVVRPRIGKGGISGLGTLFSGAYIELSPGISVEEHYEFIGLASEPVTPAGTPGLHITLESSGEQALQIGDPILFHGIDVGRIEHVHFNTEERKVYYNAFIQSPYDGLITTNTKFWQVSGIEIDTSADGIRFQSGTLETMISGGVTFDVPKDFPRGELVTGREFFIIYPNKSAINESRYKYALQYILLFKDSIRGLKPGAPVEYRGIKIGAVIRTDVKYSEITNVLDQNTLIPVMITVEPARMGFEDNEDILPEVEQKIAALLKKGLRGGLVTGNLLTGSKYIELQYGEDIMHSLDSFSGYPVIPTLESQFEQIISKMSTLMDTLNKLPLTSVVHSADSALQQVTTTLTEFQNTTAQLEILLKQSTEQNLVASIQSALENFKQLTADFSEGSLTHAELQNSLRFMKNALAELEPLLFQLNQKPNSLIFSNQKNNDIEPKGAE